MKPFRKAKHGRPGDKPPRASDRPPGKDFGREGGRPRDEGDGQGGRRDGRGEGRPSGYGRGGGHSSGGYGGGGYKGGAPRRDRDAHPAKHRRQHAHFDGKVRRVEKALFRAKNPPPQSPAERAADLLQSLPTEPKTPIPPAGRDFYPLDPEGPLCPLLRQADVLWTMLYGERARHRALLGLARECHQIPDNVDTSLVQDRALAVRMFDSPEGRRWLAEHESPPQLVALHHAIYGRFLQADRQIKDPWHDLTKVLRSAEDREGRTSRVVLSLDRWQSIVALVPDMPRRRASAVAMWACAFAMMQPENAEAILRPLIETGGQMVAAWLTTRAAPKPAAAPAPIPQLSTPEPSKPAPKKQAAAPHPAPASSPQPPPPPPPSDLSDLSDSSDEQATTLAACWRVVLGRLEVLRARPTFDALEQLAAEIADVIDARDIEAEALIEAVGEFAAANPEPELPAELANVTLRREAARADDAESFTAWKESVVQQIEDIEAREEERRRQEELAREAERLRREEIARQEAIAREAERVRESQQARDAVRVAVAEAIASLRALADDESIPAPARDSYRAMCEPARIENVNGADPDDVARWKSPSEQLAAYERAVAMMEKALPPDPVAFDENMLAFRDSLAVMRAWAATRWLKSPDDLQRAARLLEIMALPKFSWQPTRRQLAEERFDAAE